MRRFLSAVAIFLLALTVAAGALAEPPVRMMYDSIFNLLFDTNNVTLTGHAEFSLDGERFKTADAKYIQDGTNSLWQWKLLTPRKDGTEREGGYTIIANGEKVYVMEAFYPGVYKTGSTAESDTIMRRSVQLNLLRDLLRILTDQSDTLLGENAITSDSDDTGMTVHIQAGKDMPELVNTALNMTVQFVARRYFDTDYDQISERFMAPMENYITVTQGILGSTSYMSLNQADITLKRDAGWNFESLDGNASIALSTEDGVRMLDISFRLDAADYGTSKVDTFNPAEYGVKLADGSMNLREPETKSMDPDTEKRFLEMAKTRFWLAGYTVNETMKGSVRIESNQPDHEDERIHVEFLNEDGSAHWTYFTDSIGRMLGLQNMTGVWLNSYDDRHMEKYPDQKLTEETKEKLLSWLAEENPELGTADISLETDWWYQSGDELYLHFWEGGEPVDHAWDEVDFIVRIAPEWRIEFFSCIGNG